MSSDPVKALLALAGTASRFPSTSRYAGVKTAVYPTPQGDTVAYLTRRFIPPADRFALLQEHVVKQGERLDQLTARYLGDAEQFWRVCDANAAMRAAELEEEGRTVRITLPEGLPGGLNG